MTHTPRYTNQGPAWWAVRCTDCGFLESNKGNGLRTRGMAQDAWEAHLREVARIKQLVRGKHETPEAAYAHYKAMSENPDVSESDRELWKQLAEPLGRRLFGIGLPPEKQEELFTL